MGEPKLSPRHQQLYELMKLNKTNTEIAQTMKWSKSSVKTAICQIRNRLKLTSQQESCG